MHEKLSISYLRVYSPIQLLSLTCGFLFFFFFLVCFGDNSHLLDISSVDIFAQSLACLLILLSLFIFEV